MPIVQPSVFSATISQDLARSPRHLGRLRRVVELFLVFQDRIRMRRRLAALPPHLLEDIGVSRDEALDEASKPFWQ
ncbi:MAG: DUF1127 domain-containing protein [Pseudomonadota bacterium]